MKVFTGDRVLVWKTNGYTERYEETTLLQVSADKKLCKVRGWLWNYWVDSWQIKPVRFRADPATAEYQESDHRMVEI